MSPMGWCHEFGSQIREGCGHPMRAGESSCACTTCGVTCTGKFSACSAVWERGPRELTLASPVVIRRPAAVAQRGSASNGSRAAVTAEPAAVGEPGEDGRGEVLEWLRSAFDGVRQDLATLMEAVAVQQQALSTLSEAEGVTAQLVELAETLPERVSLALADAIAAAPASAFAGGQRGTPTEEMSDEMRQVLPGYIDQAVREIVRPGQGAMMNRVDEVAAELRESLVEVQASAAELRNEMARLAAFRSALVADQPELAHAVEVATERADGRLATLGQRMDALGERPEWQAMRSHLPFRRD